MGYSFLCLHFPYKALPGSLVSRYHLDKGLEKKSYFYSIQTRCGEVPANESFGRCGSCNKLSSGLSKLEVVFETIKFATADTFCAYRNSPRDSDFVRTVATHLKLPSTGLRLMGKSRSDQELLKSKK